MGITLKKRKPKRLKDKVSYSGIHKWIVLKRGNPNYCEECKISKYPRRPKGRVYKRSPFQWANISGEYKRELTDWKRLCASCHCKLDNKISNIIN